mgnify:CR=1 FL=1
MKKKNQEGYIQCPVCERAFKLKDEQFRKMFTMNVNEDLHDSISDFVNEKPHNIKLLKAEPFFQHLNTHYHCPVSRCDICHSKDPCTLKLFTTRHQRNSHIKKHHQVKEQMKGRTGFSIRIREEVLRQTQRQINKLIELQKDFNLEYPTIEVRITDYQGSPKDSIQKLTLEEKTKKKEEHYGKIKKTNTKKKHNKILKELEEQMEVQGLKMVVEPSPEPIPEPSIPTPEPSEPSPEPSVPTPESSDLELSEEEEDDNFYKLEFRHLEPLGIYNPKSEWRKLQEYLERYEGYEDFYYVYYNDSLYIEEGSFRDVDIRDLEDKFYTISDDRETFVLVQEQLSE